MRNLVYYVAITVDGFMAREDGSFADFPWDEGFIAELFRLFPETAPAPMRQGNLASAKNRRFDTVLMGRKTYEVGSLQGITNPYPTLRSYVVSSTLDSAPDPAVEVIGGDVLERVRALKGEDGMDIWLCGGSQLAALLFQAGLIDRLIVKLNPILFGAGMPLVGDRLSATALKVIDLQRFSSGHVLIEYDVVLA